jgi:hypothetical protein
MSRLQVLRYRAGLAVGLKKPLFSVVKFINRVETVEAHANVGSIRLVKDNIHFGIAGEAEKDRALATKTYTLLMRECQVRRSRGDLRT